MSTPVSLNLTVDEVNLILEALGTQPFVRVHDLVYKIKNQAQAQVAAASVSQVVAEAAAQS
jgi:hypothetical protein